MSKKTKFGWFLLGASSLAAISVTPAFAQDDVSDEIVVTATGRAAGLQDVPLAVTAVNAETVENAGVENLLDMQQLAPSLRIGSGQSTTAGTIARIRGLGTGSDNPGFESAVGFFIDGVYRARAGIAVSDLPEVERIEVLRGPQGTLFGRNTSSGAIHVITAGPDFEPGMWIEGGVGDLGYGAARAGANVPLNDSVAFRIDGSVRARDGILTQLNDPSRDYNNQNRWSTRLQGQFDFSPEASLRVIADWAETDEECCAATVLRYGITQAIIDSSYLGLVGGYAAFLPTFLTPATANLPSTGSFFSAGGGRVTSPEDRIATGSPGRDYNEAVQENGLSAQLDWEIGDMNFTSISSYRNWETQRNQDIDFQVVDLFNREGLEIDIRTATQEFRLQGEAGNLNWLVGVFYSDEHVDTTDRIRFGARAANYANALTFSQIALTPALLAAIGPRELQDGTSAFIDTFVFGGVDPVKSILGGVGILTGQAPATILALNDMYLTPNANHDGQRADNWTQDAQDIAIFTHNELALSDAMTLTAGLRYTMSEKSIAGVLDGVQPGCTSLQAANTTYGILTLNNAIANGPPSAAQSANAGLRTLLSLACVPQANTATNRTAANPWRGESEENEFSGTLSLSYRFTPDLMMYAGYSRGYKGGGYNLDRSGFVQFPGMTVAQANATVSTDQLAFDPEFTDAYEVGMRSTVFGNTYFNVTAFYSSLTDYQVNAFSGTSFITRNVPEAISQGVEVDFLSRLTENLTIQGGINYVDVYNVQTVAFVPNSAADTIFQDVALTQAPQWSVTTAITYEMPLTGTTHALFYVDARHDTDYRTQILGRNPISDMDASTTVNARLGLIANSDRWSIEAWGRNLTDQFIQGGFNLPLQSGAIGAFVNEPQTYGITLRARY